MTASSRVPEQRQDRLGARLAGLVRVPAKLDLATQGRARAAYNLLLASFLGAVLIAVVAYDDPSFPFCVILTPVTLIHLGLVRAGWVRFAAVSFTTSVLAVITAAMLYTGGLSLEGGFGFTLLVLINGLVLQSGRAALFTALAGGIASIGIVMLEQNGVIPGTRVQSSLEREITILAGLIISTALVTVAAKAYNRSRDEALRTEAQLADLVRAAPDAMVTLYTSGDIEALNPAAERLTGLDAGNSAGLHFARLLPAQDRREFAEIVQRVGAGQGPLLREFFIRPRGDETPIPVEARATRTRGRDDEPRIHLSLRDLTELKATEAERRLLEDRLQQSQRLEALGRLSGGIAHDFNNYLTVILGNATCADPNDPTDTELALAEVTEAATRAAQLTSQLLTFGRLQPAGAGGLEVNSRIHDSEQVLRLLVGDGITLKFDYSPLPLWCRVDPIQFDQVILNLVSNARDASPDNGEISLTVTQTEAPCAGAAGLPPGDYLTIAVRDHGRGISPEVERHLFEPFFTTKEPGNGTGLGLSTVHGVVTKSGGGVVVDTAPGRGSCFRVFLPRSPIPGPTQSNTDTTPERPTGRRVLLVEDDDAVRGLLVRVLRQNGHEVVEARNGKEALARLRSDVAFDVVVTDASMPQMSGPGLIDALEDLAPELPVILISGNPNPMIDGRDWRKNVTFLPKPFAPDTLLAAISDNEANDA